MLAEGVPDAVVLSRAGEVVAFCGRRFGCDNGVIDGIYFLDQFVISEQPSGNKYAGPRKKDVVPFILKSGNGGRIWMKEVWKSINGNA